MSTTMQPTPAIDRPILNASGASDLIAKAEANPELMSWLQQTFGAQVLAAEKSPLGWIGGFVVGALFTRLGITADPAAVTVIGAVAAVLGGDVWQWAKAKWWPAPVVAAVKS